MQLIVLGMHRSGTSLLGRLLNLMGAYFGPEGSSTGRNVENPKGFWERKDVRALNDAVLFSAGSDWDRVAGFDPAKVPDAALEAFRKAAGNLLLGMDGHRPWFIKEPRLCLLLPLWRPLLEAPVCVHVFRNPMEVAKSLAHRNKIPIEVGTALWERYVRDALRYSEGLPAHHVDHAELMADPVAITARLHDELVAVGVTGLRMPSASEVRAFVDPNLHRHKTTLLDDGDSGSSSAKLFTRLVSGRAFSGRPPGPLGRGIEELLADYESRLPPLVSPVQADRDGAGTVNDETRVALGRAEERVRSLENELLAARAVLEAERRVSSDRLEKLEKQLTAANSQGSRLNQQLQAYGQEIDLLRKASSDQRAQHSRTEGELGKALAEAAAANKQFAALAQERAEEQEVHASEVREAVARLAALQGDLEVALEAGRLAEQQHAAFAQQSAKDVEAARTQIKEAEARLHELQQQLKSAETNLALVKNKLAEEAGFRKKADSKLALRFDEIGKLTRILVERESEIQRLDADKTLAEWKHGYESNKLKNELVTARQQYEGILRSQSWRLTRPLRGLLRIGGKPGGANSEDPGEAGNDIALLRNSNLFDAAWYLETHADVRHAGIDAATHYLEFGVAEGRDPGPAFSTVSYLMANQDVARAGDNPLVHYLRHGKKEGRKLK